MPAHDGEPYTGTSGAPRFDKEGLDRSVIAAPLIDRMKDQDTYPEGTVFDLIIDLNLQHEAGMHVARDLVYIQIFGYAVWLQGGPYKPTVDYLTGMAERHTAGGAEDLMAWGGVTDRAVDEVVDRAKATYTPQYVYPKLTGTEISALVAVDTSSKTRALYKVWPDFDVEMMLTSSVPTVKADAARVAFSAAGDGVVWAVADTGIEGTHPHFDMHKNLDLSGHLPLKHIDFTSSTTTLDDPGDNHGHGTHVAGIIAGESAIEAVDETDDTDWKPERWAGTAQRNNDGDRTFSRWQIKEPIAGVAPLTKLVSLRVLNDSGTGKVSNLLAAIGYVQEMNDHGRLIRIHGLNMSVGYGFDPEWFGCGQSPLCVEVDRLVRSGVSVVVAAGNTGYWKRGPTEAAINSGLDLTINDPGNAQLAITVGSTHRDKPHTYGISYFSSKGPTGDGRLKPDLVAPGEKVLSCAAGNGRDEIQDSLPDEDEGKPIDYRQESGTSMAAPHVSGAIAAFLSVRKEFIGQPQRVKEIFLTSATDLGRDKYFQGHGLVDLMRAMQSL